MNIDTNGFAMGDIVKEPVTGYVGTIIGFTQWRSGCARAELLGKMTAEGKVPDMAGWDVTILELVEAGPNHFVPSTKGGPQPTPSAIGTPSTSR